MMTERCIAHSLYVDHAGVIQDVVVHDKPPIRYRDDDFPCEGRLERLDYCRISPLEGKSGTVEVAIAGELHPREHIVVNIARKRFAREQFPRVEAWNVHILAAVFGQRRYYVRPFTSHETARSVPKRERIHMKNGKRVKRDGVIGRKIDLNRQFHIPEHALSWEEVLRAVSYPEARLLLRMMRDNPDVRYLFSFHEDMEHGHNGKLQPQVKQLTRKDGVYFYDMCPDARNDADRVLIESLKRTMAAALIHHGFPLFHGIDDPRDPAFGYEADHGYIYQPIIDAAGTRRLDGTFESAMVELGRLGLTRVERAFSFEIPGRYSIAQKREMIDIIVTTFILPFCAAKGIRISSS